MRKLVGGAVVVLGVGGLGLYSNGNHSQRMQTAIEAAASGAVETTTHGVMTEVHGRDIRVSGFADSDSERDSIVATLNEVDGRRVVVDDITVLGVAAPFELKSVKGSDTQSYSGVVPSEKSRTELATQIGDGSKELMLAAGAPDGNWTTVADTGLKSLAGLNEGTMTLVDRVLTITGVAQTVVEKAAAEEMVASLPEGYSATSEITTVIPNTSPFTLTSVKSADGQTYSGEVPNEDARSELNASMGDASANLTLSTGAPDDSWTGVGMNGLASLGILNAGRMTLVDRVLTVTGVAQTVVEKAAAEQAISGLPDGYSATSEITTVIPNAAPFVIKSMKTADAQSYNGVVPSEAARGTLSARMGDAADDLVLSTGAPDANWTVSALSGLTSLDKLNEGSMSLVDRKLMITGVAATPIEKAAAEKAVMGLPDGYTSETDITSVIELASPFKMKSVKTSNGQTYSGVMDGMNQTNALTDAIGDSSAALKPAFGVPDGNWSGVATQGLSALGNLDKGTMILHDRVLTVSGVAATPAEKAMAEAAVADLPDGYSSNTVITSKLQTVSPYTMKSVKTADAQTYAGFVPDDKSRTVIAAKIGDNAKGFKHAFGAPDGNWADVATRGISALDPLNDGTMTLNDRVLTVTGTAATPVEKAAAEAAIGNLPNGYTSDVKIAMIDDGSPAKYAINYTPMDGVNVSGKLPKGASKEAIAARLGVAKVSGNPTVAMTGDTKAWEALDGRLGKMVGWLPDFESFTLEVDDKKSDFVAEVSPGIDFGLVDAALTDDLGRKASVKVAGLTTLPTDGATRTTELGGDQIFVGGFWTPANSGFVPTAASCSKAMNDVLATNKVNFLVGSANLDAKSARTITLIASFARGCIRQARLKVEIGGHTDSDGSAAGNQKLSQARAEAVKTSLTERGLPTNKMIAKGYGEEEPIATNETAEGKAANRRTTLRWFRFGE